MSSEDDKIPIWNSVTTTDLKVNTASDGAEKPQIPEGPTDSHVLAQVEQEDKGLIQKAGETADITDVGWNDPADQAEPLIAGLSNEDLWMLIRRFDKQVYCVKALPEAPLQNLDLTRADDDEFSPDKLRATIERFYTTIIVKLTSFIKHIARLRSWKETRRTSVFCAVYCIAWLLDLLVPTFFAILIALIVYPPCRSVMFPPAPIALVDKDTGGVQKPKAGVLGSHDSITGAPQNFKGEAAEQEASNLVAGVASIAVGSAVGKHDQGVPDDAPLEDTVPDATDLVSHTADAQSKAHGKVPSDRHDKTRQPMKKSVMDGANMLMQIISDVTDAFEKFENALSPTPPFPRLTPRLRLAAVLVPACLLSACTPLYIFSKLAGLGVGFGFFGDPIIRRGLAILNRDFPHWQRLFELQKQVYREANASPLPPPPTSRSKPPSRPASLHHEELTLGASSEEIHQAASAQPTHQVQEVELSPETPPKKNFASRIVGFFRGTTATGVESKQAIDRMRAVVGSRHAKNRVGVLRPKGRTETPVGPVGFAARYKGAQGAVVIDSTQEPPVLYFTTDIPQDGDLYVGHRKKGSVLFSMPVTDIREMRKLGGMGWKGKLVVGWAIGGKEVVDGLLIVGKDPKQSYQVTAMGMRNQLFNRLIAIDGQVWASF
ncbi:hypothetical protein PEBR_36955 [Penicillium brasilianum]|uniref:Uncharacterized protein n=1 Tax=Penicillium brasilianum TaxID=104259 RepID=A0A1S9RBM9_PENBI|nr:hypothetical protein PEBR_36955 [Penicillium brasilianum]